MIRVCQQCKRSFRSWRSLQKFCSHACHNESMRAARSVDLKTLQALAVSGVPKSRMARELGVGRFVVRRLVSRYGLERVWRASRYAKARAA